MDHLRAGGIYSVIVGQEGRSKIVLAKIVHLSREAVHVVILDPIFNKRPGVDDLTELDLSFTSSVQEARHRHLALSRRLFSLIRPVYITALEPQDLELSGFRKWSILDEKEVADAPDYIKVNNGKVFARIFLIFGVPFGLMQAIYQYFQHGLFNSLEAFVCGFILFGGAISLAQVLSVKLRSSKWGAGTYQAAGFSLSAYQIDEMVLTMPYSEAFDRCAGALKSLSGLKVLSEDRDGGTLEGKVSFSLSSEGEKVTVSTYLIDENQTGVVVSSVPTLGGEFDLGKNLDNVRRIMSILRAGIARE